MSLDVFLVKSVPTAVFSANITHNLNTMALHAGIYKHLWHPDAIGVTKAAQLIVPLQEGLTLLKSKPDEFKKYEPANKWGTYETLCNFIEKYLKACIENPDAKVSTYA